MLFNIIYYIHIMSDDKNNQQKNLRSEVLIKNRILKNGGKRSAGSMQGCIYMDVIKKYVLL